MNQTLSSVLQMLADDRRALRDAVERVPAYAREQRPTEDGWSVAEILEHLALIEERVTMLMTGFVAAAPMREPDAAAIDPAHAMRARLLDRTTKIIAPVQTHPPGDVDAATAMHNLEATRVQLLHTLRDAESRDLSAVTRPHPVLGVLNGYQWLESLAGHEARHAGQILEIANEDGDEAD